MRRKLLALTILTGLTVVASSAPRAEASVTCDLICDGRTNLPCTCPLASDVPGRASNCFSWQGTGSHGCFLP